MSEGVEIVQFEEVKKKRLAEQEDEYEEEEEWYDEDGEDEAHYCCGVLLGPLEDPFVDYILPPGVLGFTFVDVPGFSEPSDGAKAAYIEMRYTRKRAQQVMNPWYWKKKFKMIPTTVCFTRTLDGKGKRIIALFGLRISVNGPAGRLIVSEEIL